MKVIVFGANGRVGRLVVGELIDKGYQVTAFVHGDNPFEGISINVVCGDIYSTDMVSEAITNQDAVISTLGSWGTDRKDVLSSAMNNIIPAMNKHGINRIVSLTGQAAYYSFDKPDILAILNRLLIKLFANKILTDGESHIRSLQNSNLEWTIIRSPIMDNRDSAIYHLSKKVPMPWAKIPRKAVAKAIVDQLSNREFLCDAPYICTN